jgi:hypothetical protein
MIDNLTLLTRANAREMMAAFKLDRLGSFQPPANWLASFPARRLSRQILRFDDLLGQHGLATAGRYMLEEFTSSLRIEGQQHVPRCGPLLVVANHPGMVDAMAIWVALEHRPDLKIIAAEREILQLLPNVRSRLLFVNRQTGCLSGVLRDATRHLRRGGALLTFPAGTIEPDPALRAVHALSGWSDSTEVFVRLVPQTILLPIVVSGVISRRAHQHPIAKFFANPKEREWAAATLQVICRHLRDTHTRVLIGEPISGQCGHAAIDAAMASLLGRVSGIPTSSLCTAQRRHEAARSADAASEPSICAADVETEYGH